MKLILKDEPREWRKQAWLSLGGVAASAAFFLWRKVLHPEIWYVTFGVVALLAIAVAVMPRWFRGYYHFSMRAGYWIAIVTGKVLLHVVFALLVTPLGWLLRLAGKDPLHLKRPHEAKTYWHEAKPWGPLDRMF